MPFEIIRDKPTPRTISFGSGLAISPAAPTEPVKNEPLEEKMADEKKLDHESGGPETISQDDAGTQGAVGSGGKNAPAQEKGGTGEKTGSDKNG